VTPQPSIEAKLNPNNTNTYQIFFNTTDALSGIDNYQIKFDNFDNNDFKNAESPYTLNDNEKETKSITVKAIDKAGNASLSTLAIGDYIKQQEEAAFQAQKEKITLFDIQANTAKRSWLEFYLVLSVIALIFIIIIIWLIVRKNKK
ncbi:MAG: hypothetical protein NT116_01050, partial [Candidatus Parcubacteria bacterium]|nr:hypothetical protein [Candidatus Parcubacteria bacterium]